MKTLKSVAIIVFVFALLVGCSSNSGNGGKEEQPGTAGNASQTPAAASAAPNETQGTTGEEALPEKYDPPISLSTTMFNFNYPKFEDGEDMNNNRWSRHIEETFGIKVTTLWDVPIDQFDQKTSLMIASGDLPDYFAVSPAQFRQLYDADLIMDLTDVFESYAPEATRQVIEKAGAAVFESAHIDGKLMAIPFTGVAQDEVSVLWVRKDWFEKLGMSAPQSMGDVLAMAEAFATQDPDGNNKADTFGLGMNNTFDGRIFGFLNGYHAYKGIWVEDDAGGLAYSSVLPEMKTALEQLQQLYQAGYIDREFGVKSTEKMYEDIGEGRIGMYFGSMGEAAGKLYSVTPETEWLPFAIPSSDGQLAQMQHGPNIYSNLYWVVKKGVSNPEAIFKLSEMWLRYFYNSQTQEELDYFRATPTTGYWMNAPFKLYQSFRGQDTEAVTAVLNGEKDKSTLSLSQLGYYERILKYEAGDRTEWPIRWQYGIDSSGEIALSYTANNQYKGDRLLTTPTETMVLKMPSLIKMEEQMIHGIIMGDSLDKFDSFVTEWKKMGGDEITAEVNAWYKK